MFSIAIHLLNDSFWYEESTQVEHWKRMHLSFLVCLLDLDRYRDVLSSRRSHLFNIGRKTSTISFVIPRGRPKYVNGNTLTKQPNICARD